MRRALIFAGCLAVVAIVAIGLAQAGGKVPAAAAPKHFVLQRALGDLRGAPAPLASLHAQAGDLLGGGRKAFRARLRELRGHPVVVNKWASWCGPCRLEFPFFQQVSAARGRKVAFVGIDGNDGRGPATEFLREYPLTYPSYVDPDEHIARAVGLPAYYPMTLFLDEHGRQAYIHQGGYASRAELDKDIDRYLKP